MDDHQFKEGEIGSVGELSTVCSQIVLKCLYLARVGTLILQETFKTQNQHHHGFCVFSEVTRLCQ